MRQGSLCLSEVDFLLTHHYPTDPTYPTDPLARHGALLFRLNVDLDLRFDSEGVLTSAGNILINVRVLGLAD